MTRFKNIVGMEFVDFLKSSPEMYMEAFFQMINDASETAGLSETSSEWVGIVLSGEMSGKGDGDKDEKAPFLNEIAVVDFGDGVERLEMKVRLFNHEVTDCPVPIPTDMIPSPFEGNLSLEERQWRISLHPNAYTVFRSSASETFNFGDLVALREEDGVYFITKSLTNPMFLPAGEVPEKDGNFNFNIKIGKKTAASVDEFVKKMQNTGYFEGYSVAMLYGIAANAQKESGFVVNIAGDCSNDARGIKVSETYRGGKKCCSFGFTQMHICGGAGVDFCLWLDGNSKRVELFYNDVKVSLASTTNVKTNVSCLVLPEGRCSEFTLSN